MPHVEKDLLTLPEHLRAPLVFGRVRIAYSLFFFVVSCVLLFGLFVFFSFLAMALSVYFQINEFDCPSSIFRPSFTWSGDFKVYGIP